MAELKNPIYEAERYLQNAKEILLKRFSEYSDTMEDWNLLKKQHRWNSERKIW